MKKKNVNTTKNRKSASQFKRRGKIVADFTLLYCTVGTCRGVAAVSSSSSSSSSSSCSPPFSTSSSTLTGSSSYQRRNNVLFKCCEAGEAEIVFLKLRAVISNFGSSSTAPEPTVCILSRILIDQQKVAEHVKPLKTITAKELK